MISQHRRMAVAVFRRASNGNAREQAQRAGVSFGGASWPLIVDRPEWAQYDRINGEGRQKPYVAQPTTYNFRTYF